MENPERESRETERQRELVQALRLAHQVVPENVTCVFIMHLPDTLLPAENPDPV